MKYLGIGLTSATFAFFLSLSTGLLDAGIRAHGDDQAVITALGGTTFGINILVGIIAMIVVAVLSLKRRGDGASQSNQGIVTLNAGQRRRRRHRLVTELCPMANARADAGWDRRIPARSAQRVAAD